MSFLSRIFKPSARKHVEGQYRDGPWHLPVTGGWLPHSWGSSWNWWQLGYSPISGQTSAMVQACVSRYAQTIAMCPGSHWRTNPDGGRERVVNSALNRILRKPNGYQTISDFLLNATRSLYLDGNAYALALRNDRFEIYELHLMNPRQCSPRVAETGDVFYSLSGNEIVDRRFAGAAGLLNGVPSRDVLHIRLDTPMHPLKGETPLTAAAIDIAASNAIASQQLAFYLNQARPSYILSTDQILTKEQTSDLRARWDEQSQGLNQGKTPIMAAGLKPLPLSGTARDAQLAEIMKMSEQRIALVYQIPMAILGIGGGSQTYASTEILMQQWVASGLGFALNHIEEAFGILFGLKGQPDEYLEFDTEVLLRSAFKDRVEGYVRGVQGGVFAPDEARAAFELPESPGGHGKEARVQSQVVPLSAAQGIPSAPAAPAAPAAPVTDDESDEPEKDESDGRDYAELILAAAQRHAERAG